MSRNKKSRKIGRLTSIKSEKKAVTVEREQRQRKQKGNKAGSRQQVEDSRLVLDSKHVNKDPRLGSKKLIDLGSYAKSPEKVKQEEPNIHKPLVAPIKVAENTPTLEEELISIESDLEIQRLAEKAESDEELTVEEAVLLESTLSRYQELIALLGLQVEEGHESNEFKIDSEDELWSRLDDADLSDYKE